MNAPFTPADLQADYANVFALLAVLADPEKTRARLNELIAQEKAVDEKTAAFNEMHADTRRLHSAAEATTIVLNNRKAALDTREGEIDTRAAALELTESTRSHKSLQRREAACLAREEAAAREEKRLATVKTDLHDKHEKIRRLTTDIS
jgi:hypothetical protein